VKAVVVGSGPNGLAAAIVLAQAGHEVVVHEAAERVGGGMQSGELTLPGFVHDVCSAVHPLAVASPAFRNLELDVDWVQPEAPCAHPLDDGTAVVLERSLAATARQLGADGAAYERLVEPYVRAWSHLASLRLGRAALAIRPWPLLQGFRAAAPLARSLFAGEPARGFFAGQCAHSMLPLERKPSAGFGIALLTMAHTVGWPFPRGGAQRLADALAAKLAALGGEVRLGSPVDELPHADVVLADTSPRELRRIARLPDTWARAFRHGPGAFKLDWALAGPIAWTAPEVARAGTVHLGGTLDELSRSEWDAWSGRATERPFVLLSQPSLFDPTRAPQGRHTAWAYCHLPNGSAENMTERIEAQIERYAPGFRDLVLARHELGPPQLEEHDRNLVGGDLNGGAMDLPQLWFRPAARLVPYRTPRRGVYLCSSSTPPGGGVHGLCGYAAARLALRDLT
jgi:phytoene dehydrogenase-like protein